jgi:hypothetical protein
LLHLCRWESGMEGGAGAGWRLAFWRGWSWDMRWHTAHRTVESSCTTAVDSQQLTAQSGCSQWVCHNLSQHRGIEQLLERSRTTEHPNPVLLTGHVSPCSPRL